MRYFVLFCLALAACLDELPTCPGSDELICPRGTECVLGTCLVEPAACGGFEDGRLCGDGTQIRLAGACVESTCGDGFADPFRGETCDQGPANSDLEPDACRTSCHKAACGDGVLDEGEDPYCLDIVGRIAAPAADLRLVRADLDGDGQDDLVGTYRDEEHMVVSTWRIQPSGRIEPEELVARFADPFSTQPSALLVADLDGDGEDELAVAARDQAGVALVYLLRREAGVWSNAGSVPMAALEIVDLAVHDLDGDGDLELLAAGHDLFTLTSSLLICQGAPGELPGADCATQSIVEARSLSLAHVDEDERIDAVLLVEKLDRSEVQVHTFDEAGKLVVAEWFTPRPSRIVPVVEDVKGLRSADIVLSVDSQVEVVGLQSVFVPLPPAGQVEVRVLFDPILGIAGDLAVVNLDDDDRADVVAIESTGLSVSRGENPMNPRPLQHFEHVVVDLVPRSLVTSPGAAERRPGELVVVGTVTNQPEIVLLRAGDGVIGGPRSLAGTATVDRLVDALVVDLYDDGADDLLVLDGSLGLTLFRDVSEDPHGDIPGEYFREGPLAKVRSRAAAVGDLDGDGRPDLVIASHDPDDPEYLAVSLASAGPLPGVIAAEYLLEHQASSVTLFDLDGDGDLDVLAVDPAGSMTVFANGEGTGELTAQAVAPTPRAVRQLVVAEVSGDALADLLLVDTDYTLSIWPGEQAADGSLAWPSLWRERPDVAAVAVGDVSGEAELELAVVATGGSVEVLSLAGDALEPVVQEPPLVGEAATDVAFADVNGDGRLDLVLLDAGISVYLHSETRGRFTGGQHFSSAPHGQRQLRVDDVDGDGVTDVIVVLDNQVDWHRGRRQP